MLPEIAAEVLQFLSRRDLDKASAISRWLDALIAQCCDVYPLRPVLSVALYSCGDEFEPERNQFELTILTEPDEDSRTIHSFGSMVEALHFAGRILSQSYIERLELGDYRNITLSPDNWNTLMNAIRGGAVQSLSFSMCDFDALSDDAMMVLIGCCGLKSLEMQRCVIPSGLAMDDLVRYSVAKGLLQLRLYQNHKSTTSDASHSLSDEGVLDFCFLPDTSPGEQPRRLTLEELILEGPESGLTENFLVKMFERLRSNPVHHSGVLEVDGGDRQLGLSAYDHYLVQAKRTGVDTYRFPTTIDDEKSVYVVYFDERPGYMYIHFYPE